MPPQMNPLSVKKHLMCSQKNTNTNVEEAKQEGIEIGKKIASKELENEQQKTLETFRDIIDNIKKRND